MLFVYICGIMKRYLLIIVLALVSLIAMAQEKDERLMADIRENPFRCSVVLDPYEVIPASETPVPKGYKAFYI